MKGKKVKLSVGAIVKYIFLVFYAITCLYPFMWMIGTSLKSSSEALSNPASPFPMSGLHWETYSEVWGKLNFSKYFLNSMAVSITVVITVVIIYSMIGFAISKINFVGKNVIFYMYVALILVPGLTVQIPLYLNMVALNLNNTFMGLVLPMINGAGPFAVFMFKNYFDSLSQELYEAAKIDGCSIFKIFYKIYFPLALPVIGTIAVMNFIGTWNGIVWPMIILTDKSKFTLPMAVMYLDQSAFKQWNVVMAGSIFSVIPVIIVFMCLQKFYIQGLTSGAIKG